MYILVDPQTVIEETMKPFFILSDLLFLFALLLSLISGVFSACNLKSLSFVKSLIIGGLILSIAVVLSSFPGNFKILLFYATGLIAGSISEWIKKEIRG